MSDSWALRDVFYAVKKFQTARNLQDVIYLGQELGTLSKRYQFDSSGSSFALPYSLELERDLLRLESQRIIFDTRKPGTIILTEQSTSSPSSLDEKTQRILRKIADVGPNELDSLTAVLWAKSVLSDEGNSRKKVKEREIADYLATDIARVQRYLRLAKKLKDD